MPQAGAQADAALSTPSFSPQAAELLQVRKLRRLFGVPLATAAVLADIAFAVGARP
jgi:hypothetical protein